MNWYILYIYGYSKTVCRWKQVLAHTSSANIADGTPSSSTSNRLHKQIVGTQNLLETETTKKTDSIKVYMYVRRTNMVIYIFLLVSYEGVDATFICWGYHVLYCASIFYIDSRLGM